MQDEVTAGFTLPEDGCSPVTFAVDAVDIPAGALATWTIDTPFGTDTTQGTVPSAPDWLTDPTAGPTGYSVTLDVVDPLTGCTAQHTDSLTVFPQPVGTMSVTGLSGCEVIATFAYSGPAESLTWNFGDPFEPGTETTTAASISHAYPNPLGTGYTATATVTAAIGACTHGPGQPTSRPSMPTFTRPTRSAWAPPCSSRTRPLVPLAMGIARVRD